MKCCMSTCQDMDELVNFWARSGSQSGCHNQIAFSDMSYRLGYRTLQPWLGCQRAALLCRILRWEKSHIYVLAAHHLVLTWFYSPSCRRPLSEVNALYRVPLWFYLQIGSIGFKGIKTAIITSNHIFV